MTPALHHTAVHSHQIPQPRYACCIITEALSLEGAALHCLPCSLWAAAKQWARHQLANLITSSGMNNYSACDVPGPAGKRPRP